MKRTIGARCRHAWSNVVRRGGTAFVALLAALLVGCGDPIGCDVCHTDAIVYGTLTGAEGAAVAQRQIAVAAFRGSCDDRPRANADMVTDPSGSFRGQLYSLFGPFTADCLSVTVRGEAGAADVVKEFPASLDFRFEANPARLDSVRLDITL